MNFIRSLYNPKLSEILLREQLYRQNKLPVELNYLIEEHWLNSDSSATLSEKYGGTFNIEWKGADKKRYFDYRNAILFLIESKVQLEKKDLGLDYPKYLHWAMKASLERKLSDITLSLEKRRREIEKLNAELVRELRNIDYVKLLVIIEVICLFVIYLKGNNHYVQSI